MSVIVNLGQQIDVSKLNEFSGYVAEFKRQATTQGKSIIMGASSATPDERNPNQVTLKTPLSITTQYFNNEGTRTTEMINRLAELSAAARILNTLANDVARKANITHAVVTSEASLKL